jgi:hypothetical protein
MRDDPYSPEEVLAWIAGVLGGMALLIGLIGLAMALL